MKRRKKKRHHEQHVIYGVAGYGWGTPGWTAQSCLQPGQFGSATTDTGSMTTATAGDGAGGGATT